MRSIARQSARLAKHSRAGSSVGPRRDFHPSVRSSSEPRNNPPGQNPPNTPFQSRQEDKNGEDEKTPASSTAVRSQIEEEDVKPTNGGRSTIGSRKILRQRRSPREIPKPPPIPDWFLKHNVLLQSGSPPTRWSADDPEILRCIDRETGHTLFTLPYFRSPSNIDKPRPEPAHTPLESLPASQGLQSDLSLNTQIPWAAILDALAPRSFDKAKFNHCSYDNLLEWSILELVMSATAAFALATAADRHFLRATSEVDIALLCPDNNAHDDLDNIVQSLARLTASDLIRLDANDFADLTADYVGHGSDSPGAFSDLAYDTFTGYEAVRSPSTRPVEENEDDDADEDDDEGGISDEGGHHPAAEPHSFNTFTNFHALTRALQNPSHTLHRAFVKLDVDRAVVPIGVAAGRNSPNSKPEHSTAGPDFDDARLGALLDKILDAAKVKRENNPQGDGSQLNPRVRPIPPDPSEPHAMYNGNALRTVHQETQSLQKFWFPRVAALLAGYVQNSSSSGKGIGVDVGREDLDKNYPSEPRRRTIVHVRDIGDIRATTLGNIIIRRLVSTVQKRRRAGEEVLIVGTVASDSVEHMIHNSYFVEFLPLRSLVVPPYFRMAIGQQKDLKWKPFTFSTTRPAYTRILEINLRNIESMLRRLRPDHPIDLFSETAQRHFTLPELNVLGEKVLGSDMVHNIALTALGLSLTHAKSDVVDAIHIVLATLITSRADEAVQTWVDHRQRQKHSKARAGPNATSSEMDAKARIDRIRSTCNPHEARLLSGVVDARNIATGFAEVHAPSTTIDALRTLTSLSLLRPDAFKYGVLATDRLPGLMLYGPPGTGKTLLAKAVAKESRATVLEVTGAQIYEKYVGEGEKMVRAVFSLAKKLAPCIVFIDEADAIFGMRSSAGSRNTHREILNQFLREWDGMDSHAHVFLMVASNRPFDIDDAVLRRLPRRLLVDLPVQPDRESILRIHLRGEHLDPAVSLAAVAAQTPLYSGSDLKNVCIAAALACVREENALAAQRKDDPDFRLPDHRTLAPRHFDIALKEISASISEDMKSLSAIRKFDEQYGDRQGRKTKAEYGFGMGGDRVDESAARIRQPPPPPPPPPPPSPTP